MTVVDAEDSTQTLWKLNGAAARALARPIAQGGARSTDAVIVHDTAAELMKRTDTSPAAIRRTHREQVTALELTRVSEGGTR